MSQKDKKQQGELSEEQLDDVSGGQEVVKIVRDNWRQALDYLHDGTASVVVVACRNRLDPAREPRVEIATTGGGLGPDGQPRPRLIE